MPAHDYSAQVAPAGSNLYYASLFLAPQSRARMLALHAFATEIGDSLQASQDPGVVRLRLHWWQEELQRCAAGQARHPVAVALQDLLQTTTLDVAELHAYLQACEVELQPLPPGAGFPELLQQVSRATGHCWQLGARLCDVEEPVVLNKLQHLGGLHQLFLAQQDLPRQLRQGMCRAIPPADLQAAGLQPRPPQSGEYEAWAGLLQRQLQRLQTEMESTLVAMPRPRTGSVLPYRVFIRLDLALCREILRDECDLLRKRYALTPLRKLWIAWKVQWRGL